MPGYGHMPPPRPPRPPAAEGDPAPRGQRLASWSIDAAIILVVVVALGSFTLDQLNSTLTNRTAAAIPEVVLGVLFSGGDVAEAARELGGSLWNTVVSSVQRTILIIMLIEAVYHFAMVAWRGRTVGRLVTSLQVRPFGRTGQQGPTSDPRASGRAVRPGLFSALVRALATVATSTGLYGLAWIILIHGQFGLAVLTWLAAVGLLVANVLLAMLGGRRSVSDRLARTVVVRTLAYAKAAQLVMRSGRENADRIAQNQTIQQFKDTGARWRDQVRDSDSGRRLGKAGQNFADRVKGAYDQRRDPGGGPPPDPPPPGATPPGPPPPPGGEGPTRLYPRRSTRVSE